MLIFVTRKTPEGSIVGAYIDAQMISSLRDIFLEESALVCEQMDKSTHPSDVADNIRKLKGCMTFPVPPILEV